MLLLFASSALTRAFGPFRFPSAPHGAKHNLGDCTRLPPGGDPGIYPGPLGESYAEHWLRGITPICRRGNFLINVRISRSIAEYSVSFCIFWQERSPPVPLGGTHPLRQPSVCSLPTPARASASQPTQAPCQVVNRMAIYDFLIFSTRLRGLALPLPELRVRISPLTARKLQFATQFACAPTRR